MKRLRIATIMLASAATPLLGQTLTISPTIIANGSTSQTINVSCSGCVGWVAGTPGTPTFTVSGATVVSQVVNTTSTATLVLTPTVTNNYVYITAPRVSGASSPALAVLTVQPTFSASQPFIVNGTTGNVITVTGIGASWTTGTPGSPTFALSGCPTASITSQTVTSATTANLTLSAGTTDCTITITDPSTSNTTTLAVQTPAHWYVRTGGGTRYSANETSGQCDGLADVNYPGSGVNQHCAFSDVRYLWQDGSSTSGGAFPAYGWVIKGGDTVTIRGSIADGVSWRIGWQTSAGCGSTYPFWGLCGDSNDSAMPSPPSGIASDHTVIQGGNAGACTTQTARTQLHGGWGVDNVILVGSPLQYTSTTLSNSDFVDFACLDVTDFAGPGGADFAKAGIKISLPAHDVTLTDMRIHGLTSDGILGTTGGDLTATDIQVMGNGSSGWESDEGAGVTGFGAMNVTNYQIEGNGCIEEYPVVDTFPYTSCTDDSSSGYGDGFGTASINSPAPGWTVHFDQGTVDYNTQDGIDALHLAGDGSSSSVTRTLAYGNMGQQVKIGGGGSVVNNLITGNCGAMSGSIPGFPAAVNITSWSITGNVASFVTGTQSLVAGQNVALSGFGTSTFFNGSNRLAVSATGLSSTTFQVPFTHANGSATEAGLATTWNGSLSDFCRASNTAVVIEIPPATTSKFEFNTIYSQNSVALEIEPYDVLFGAHWVGTEAFQYVDNTMLGFSTATPIYNSSDNSLAPLTNAGGLWEYNDTYQGASWTCPHAGESNALCVTPGLTNQTYPAYGYVTMTPASGASAVVGAGLTISGVTTDYAGTTRHNPPTIGAYEGAVPPAIPVGGGTINGRIAIATPTELKRSLTFVTATVP